MPRSNKRRKLAGRVRIDIASTGAGGIQVTVARACNNPTVLKLVDEALEDISRRYPKVVIKEVQPDVPLSALVGKRGGPAGTPENKRIEIVKDWFKAQGRIKEVDYAASHGISPATLRRWTRELVKAGKL